MAEIIVCSHCGDKKGTNKGKFCKFCDSVEKRREMDENNKKIWKERLNKDYKCKYCEKEKLQENE